MGVARMPMNKSGNWSVKRMERANLRPKMTLTQTMTATNIIAATIRATTIIIVRSDTQQIDVMC